jgi:hypothetical protein
MLLAYLMLTDLLPDEAGLPEQIKKRLIGLRTRVRKLKADLSGAQLKRFWRGDVELDLAAALAHAERENKKLARATWVVVHDAPNATARDIVAYLRKVRVGLGLD